MRTGFNVDAIFQANIRRKQNFLATIDCISDVVEPSLRAGVVTRVCKIVALVRTRHPDRGFRAIVQENLFGQTKAQVLFEKLAVGFDIDREPIPMIETPYVDAPRGKFLRLVLEGRPQLRRRLIPLGFIIKLNFMSVWVLAEKPRTMRQIAFRPAYVEARSFEGRYPPFESLRTSCAISHMAQAREVGCRQLQGMPLIIIIGMQVDRVALPAGLGHSHNLDEKLQALFRLGGEQFQVAEVSKIHYRFVLHDSPLRARPIEACFD